MKKGISLIVLVITIIVMIIIAGAIILALNSSNVTNKASWAQITADRANLQSEYATILADVVAKQPVGTDYVGVEFIEDVKANDTNYGAWATKVGTTNARFVIAEPDTMEPAGLKVVMYISAKEATGFGLTYSTTTGVVTGYDWVKVDDAKAEQKLGTISASNF